MRTSFQRLSRLDDESGTRNVYRRITGTDTDLHLYSVTDRLPPREVEATVHGGYTDEFRHTWFVVHCHPDADAEQAALVAYEVGSNEWRGTWPFDTGTVRAINRYVERRL
ncbi:MAG: hypothetical protein ABEJ30_05670 [Halorientalis sp.]